MLEERSYGEDDYVLFLSESKVPIAEILDDAIRGKLVTARYWITDTPCTKEDANEDFMRQVMGLAKTEFGARYSEITGFLWTDEECKIGGHDLIAEIRGSVGKYLILEIEIHGETAHA
jgi:hypothetical protein